MTLEKLTEGRIVHFVVRDTASERHPHAPAIVTEVHNAEAGLVTLTVFRKRFTEEDVQARHSDAEEPGSWHWIETA